ncbi:hypothetical protein [Ferruginibacter sp. SUN106]|uniref:hypothetical protein n=1 Tax=Ferruginibacter sp. SUN106 TaxID=2978348 RepID=UPI003D35A323
MKNSDPIQLAILIIALLVGYNAVETVPYFLWVLYRWFEQGLTLAGDFYTVTLNLFYLIFYITVATVLIRRSKTIAQKIASGISFSNEIKIVLKKEDVLYVTFVAMGAYILTTRLPKLLIKLYEHIKERNQSISYEGPNLILPKESIPEFLITIILATTMLVYAKTITEFLVRQIKEDTAVDTIGDNLEEMK